MAPLVVAQQLVRPDVPVMIVASGLALVLALDGVVGRLDGLLSFAGAIGYTTLLIRQSRHELAGVRQEYDEVFGGEAPKRSSPLVHIGLMLIDLAMLVFGAGWRVDAAVTTATALGVSEMVIGLTVVAAGTSIPEVATSVLATIRGERVNVVGSNIFNLLAGARLRGAAPDWGAALPPPAPAQQLPGFRFQCPGARGDGHGLVRLDDPGAGGHL